MALDFNCTVLLQIMHNASQFALAHTQLFTHTFSAVKQLTGLQYNCLIAHLHAHFFVGGTQQAVNQYLQCVRILKHRFFQ